MKNTAVVNIPNLANDEKIESFDLYLVLYC